MNRKERLILKFTIWIAAVFCFVWLQDIAELFLQDGIWFEDPTSFFVKISFVVMMIVVGFLGSSAMFDLIGVHPRESVTQDETISASTNE